MSMYTFLLTLQISSNNKSKEKNTDDTTKTWKTRLGMLNTGWKNKVKIKINKLINKQNKLTNTK